MPHPHQATLDLLRVLVAHLPPRFPYDLGRYMVARLGELERDASVSREALDRVVAEFGMYTWHHRRAWEEAYQRDGAPDEEQRFLAALPEVLRARVAQDAAAARGGEIASPDVEEARSAGKTSGVERSRQERAVRPRDIVRLPAFERYTPEDRLVIEESLLRARREAGDRLAARILAGEISDYDTIALRWKQERLRIEEQLLKLRDIARRKPQLAPEIEKVIAEYEVGFSGLMGREPMLAELKGVVADYGNRN